LHKKQGSDASEVTAISRQLSAQGSLRADS